MKIALLLIVLLPSLAQAVNKCNVAGKVIYTDIPCERLGGWTAKSFTPQPNVVESQATADVKRKIANGEMTVTQTRINGNGLQESRTLQPHEITRDVMDELQRNRTVTVPPAAQIQAPLPVQQATPARASNQDACQSIDNALAMNAAAARQPNTPQRLDQLAAERRRLYEQRSQTQCGGEA